MRPCDVFDICAEVYVQARGAVERTIGPVRVEMPYRYLWRPDVLPRPVDYVADFYRAGRRALAAPRWRGRLRMFLLHYCELVEYPAARARLGLSELTWSQWRDDIRDLVGRELLRARVFPPGAYFHLLREEQRARSPRGEPPLGRGRSPAIPRPRAKPDLR
jgi:hypothetical protein